MTPDVLGFYSGKHNGRAVFVEFSTGDDFLGEKMIGVTVRYTDGVEPKDTSRCLHSMEEAETYVQEAFGRAS